MENVIKLARINAKELAKDYTQDRYNMYLDMWKLFDTEQAKNEYIHEFEMCLFEELCE